MLAGHGLDLALLMLRVAAGGFLLPHALGKLFGWFGGPGLAVLLGWQTRIAALAAAAFIGFTVLLALPRGWFWMRGGSEYPLMWTTVLLAIALAGPGTWALDVHRLPGDLA